MIRPQRLCFIAIYGAAGAGKTTLTDILHAELAYTAHIGADHIKRFISEFREVPSHQEVSKKVVNAMAAEYLKNGINVILEGTFTRKELEIMKDIVDKEKADFLVYRLEASLEVCEARIAERTKTLNKPTIPQETIDALHKIHQENDYPNTAVLDSGKLSTREMADQIIKDLT